MSGFVEVHKEAKDANVIEDWRWRDELAEFHGSVDACVELPDALQLPFELLVQSLEWGLWVKADDFDVLAKFCCEEESDFLAGKDAHGADWLADVAASNNDEVGALDVLCFANDHSEEVAFAVCTEIVISAHAARDKA